MNHHIPKKGSQSPDSRANPSGASKTALSTECISSAQARSPSRKKGPDNSPRRSHNPESPRAYPGFRDHLIDHLRAHLSLSEIASARLSDLSISPPQVTIGTKQITSPALADVFDNYLKLRSKLAQALPALTESDAYLFPALDGGPLLVSHRPKGMLSDGLRRFVETRDTLIDFILPFVNESQKVFSFLVSMNLQNLAVLISKLEKSASPLVSAKARQLSDDYLAARTHWLKELTVFSKMIEGHESKSRSSPLEAKIESLLNAPTLSKAEKTQLRELREVKASFDLQNERRKQLRMSARQIKVDERIELAERQGRYDPLDEERITPAIKPVVPPLKNLAFLGTDGGTVVGDT